MSSRSGELRWSVEILELRTRDPFTIARGGSDRWTTVVVEAEEGGTTAYGEGAPRSYYGEDAEGTARAVRSWLEERSTLDVADPRALAALGEHRMAARSALDLLLHDLAAQRAGLTMVDHLAHEYGLEAVGPPPASSFTIGLDTTERMVEKVEEAAEYPILKVKLGTERDLEILRAIRGATDASLRVDANAAWTVDRTRRMAPILAELGVDLLEQPLARDDLAGYAELHGTVPLPVFVDESVRHEADVERLAGLVDGINLKLAKCGGLGPCARMVSEARRRGLGVMIGCFVESSISISAGAALSRFADHADLDGAALLAEEPFAGASIPAGRIVLPSRPGLGAHRSSR